MGRIPEPNKPVAQPLQHMWERHYEIARRLLAGDSQATIAKDMGMTQGRLSIICHSPIFENHLATLRAKSNNTAVDVRTRISECSPLAIKVLADIIADTPEAAEKFDPRLRVKVAQDMLDRDGFGAVQKVNTFSAILTVDDIDRLKQRRMTIVNP